MGWWPFSKKVSRGSLSPEMERVFARLRQFLDDESAQNAALPENFRDALLKNAPCDRIANGFGEFGRTLTNPIPVNGPVGELLYLSSLATASDVPVAFHRLGSHEGIDTFEIVSEDGRFRDVLYLSLYFPRKSRALPTGYQRISDRRRGSLTRGTTLQVNGFPEGIYEAAAECAKRLFGVSIADPQLKSLEGSHPARTQRHLAVLRQLKFTGTQTVNPRASNDAKEVQPMSTFYNDVFALLKRNTEESARRLGATLSHEFDNELSYVLLYVFTTILFQDTSRTDPGQTADRLAKLCLTHLAARQGVPVDILLRNYRARFDGFRQISLFVTGDRFLVNEGALMLGGLIVAPANMAFGMIFLGIVQSSLGPLRERLASL